MRSMTGFGAARVDTNKGGIYVEIKTLNHRFFDINFRIPPQLGRFELRIKKFINQCIKRGRIDIFLSLETIPFHIILDKEKAKQYYQALRILKKHLKLKDPLTLSQIVMFPEVITCKRAGLRNISWEAIKEAVDVSLKKALRAKEKEGRIIAKDLTGRTARMQTIFARIERRFSQLSKARLQRVVKTLPLKVSGRSIFVDKGRLEESQLSGYDISEEITRTRAHLNSLRGLLKKNGEIGKQLDFMAQELYREINTIGAKAQDFNIARDIIEVKSLVESLREQAMNIE